jgi:hypothetical protein
VAKRKTAVIGGKRVALYLRVSTTRRPRRVNGWSIRRITRVHKAGVGTVLQVRAEPAAEP